MPFTLSHPAAILPLHRWSRSRLPLAALTIGSMTPDTPYFAPLPLGGQSHSFLGIVLFCLPVGLSLWIVFEYLLKEPTLDMMPNALRARVSHEKSKLTWRSLGLVAIALMLGALTHIVWDSFTHATSPVVLKYHFLRMTVVNIGDEPLRLYKFLQHTSTLIGLLVLAYAAIGWWRRNPGTKRPSPVTLSATYKRTAIVAILVAAVLSAIADHVVHSHGPLERQMFFVAVGGMSGFAIAWCGVAMLITLKKSMGRRLEHEEDQSH